MKNYPETFNTDLLKKQHKEDIEFATDTIKRPKIKISLTL